jgi:hypothetical protein
LCQKWYIKTELKKVPQKGEGHYKICKKVAQHSGSVSVMKRQNKKNCHSDFYTSQTVIPVSVLDYNHCMGGALERPTSALFI